MKNRHKHTIGFLRKLNLLQEVLLGPENLQKKLQRITSSLVEIFDADFSRIWISLPGDRCDSGCIHVIVKEESQVCSFRERCLHLMASSGRYTHIDGPHSRMPFDLHKIGRIASGKTSKFLTNDIVNDPQIRDQEWARKIGLISFAGYKLQDTSSNPIGVLALFSKHPINAEENALIENLAGSTAQVIQSSKAEESLRISETRLLKAEKIGQVGFWDWNPITGELIWSEETYRILGLSPVDVIPSLKLFLDIVHPEDRKFFEKAINDALHKKKPYGLDFRILSRDGVERVAYALGEVKFNESNKPIRMFGTFQNITERKKAENRLKLKAEQQLETSRLGLMALSGIELDEIFQAAIVNTSKTLELEYAKILELLPDGKSLLLRKGVGWKEGLVGHATIGTELDSQAGFTLKSNQPVIVKDLREESRFSGPSLLLDHGVISGMSVIIKGKDRPFGVLGVHTTQHKTFTEDDVNFLQITANVLAEAIGSKRAEEKLKKTNQELQDSLVKVKALSGLLPICSHCKKIRNDKGYWEQIEGYIKDHSEAEFSHCICPNCFKKFYPEFYDKNEDTGKQ